MTAMTPLTRERCEQALNRVAAWMGAKYFDGQPCPTGHDAAYRALGPHLLMEFTGVWTPQPPTPTIIVEGIPGADWANWASAELRDDLHDIGIHAEPLTGYALSLYPAN